MPNEALDSTVQRIADKAGLPDAWEAKLELLLDEGPKPQLKALRALLAEGERIDWELNGLADLKEFVEKCSEVAEEALGYTTRKQQARRKNEGRGRGRGKASTTEAEDKEREYRNIDSIEKLLVTADNLCFESPEITALRERFDSIAEFQEKARTALLDRPVQQSIVRLDELLEEGKSFNVDVPELDSLERVVTQLKWLKTVDDCRQKAPTLKDVSMLIEQGIELRMPDNHPEVHFLQDKKIQGELWEAKAKELMSVENVHYQQLDALSKQANSIPVVPETLAAVDAILKKQRDAQELILSLYERSKNPDFRQRPKYLEVRNAVEALSALNSKPTGTIDLEREQKRHEDWMRRGKKLFGKANAPLHILHAHMKSVDERNIGCFDLSDQPRMPVEPSSRANTPEDDEEEADGSGSSRDVFCICRKPEAGIMIECDLCHEW
jgi:histone demethylase JARID1